MDTTAVILKSYLHRPGCTLLHPKHLLFAGLACLAGALGVYLVTRSLEPSWRRTISWLLYMTALLTAIVFIYLYLFEQLCPG